MGTTATQHAPADVLELHESTFALPSGAVQMPQSLIEAYDDETRAKMIPLIVIRPGLGRGRGRHLYEAKMLEENAHKFSGWKMFVDHLSPAAKKAAGGLPRSIRDLGGRIVESHWDPSIPADPKKGHAQGGVVGWAIPTPFVRDLVDNDPELVEASISANATGVRPVNYEGARAWLVEGIEDRGSVDWVTEAGAGGRVVALMEAAYSEDGEGDLLSSLTDAEFIAYVEEQRPHLIESADEHDLGDPPNNDRENEDMKIDPAALAEAFQSDEVRDALSGVIKDIVKDEVATATAAAVEEAVADEGAVIRAEAQADAARQVALRDMRDEAHGLIEAAKLPDVLSERIRGKFDLTESGPTPGLDLVDEVDGEGAVTKSASEKLREAVEQEITAEREVLAAVNPARVTGQGATAEGEGGDATQTGKGTLYGSMLQEAGIDPETAWAS